MGSSRWSPSDWKNYSTTRSSQTAAQIFTNTRGIHADLDPKGIKVRESRDSDQNPNSTPIIIGVDVTGSMGRLAEVIVKKGLGTLIEAVYDRKPVLDPHVMLMAIGDVHVDSAPLQMTQFEADLRLAEQIEKFFIEGGGGGNGGESYNLAWYAAATKTSCDSMIKRQKKGYLFTIGDENVHPQLDTQSIERVFGEPGETVSNRDLLTMASRDWEIFHLIVDEAGYGNVEPCWKPLLGERAMHLSDHTKLAEVIVSTMQVVEGADAAQVAGSWDGTTNLVVAKAVQSLTAKSQQANGIVKL